MRTIIASITAATLLWASGSWAAPLYLDGDAPADGSLVFGDHLVGGALGSVAGIGGSGISNSGDALNGLRTYTFDTSAQPDLTDGIANRGDPGFAMLIWDMGAAYDSMRLYTHQDHIFDGPNTGPLGIVTNFVAQDVMEYSVWGSHDGNDFVLLSDVIAFDIVGGGVGRPTYTFAGAEPTVVYRGGSAENGVVNAYTREYVFDTAYQYYGIRTSQISLTIPGGGVDADPEIDAIAAFNTQDRCDINPNDPSCVVSVPEPGTLALLGLALFAMGLAARRRVIV